MMTFCQRPLRRQTRWLLVLPLILPIGCADTPATTVSVAQKKKTQSVSTPNKVVPVRPKPAPSPSPEELRRLQWQRVVPVLKWARKQMEEAYAINQADLQEAAIGLITNEGIHAFIDDALGMESAWDHLQGHDQQEWIRKKFATHILPIEKLQELVVSFTEQLDASFLQLETETLIEIDADVDLSPQQLQVSQSDLDQMSNHFDLLIAQIEEAMQQSVGNAIKSFGAGMVGFELAHQASRSAMKDENGEVSIIGELLSLGIGIVADQVTRTVTDEVLQTRQVIERELREASSALLRQCTATGSIAEKRERAVDRHHGALVAAVIESLGVEPKWAMAFYQKEQN